MIPILNNSKTLPVLKNKFFNPDPEFTPIPFWFWNDALEEAEIKRQIRSFRDKGVMGFVIHPRIGMPEAIQYLSERFLKLVGIAVAEAAGYGMRVILYDEGMYPSGSAHGMVVAGNPEYATRGLRMLELPWTAGKLRSPELIEGENLIAIIGVEKIGPQAVRRGSAISLELRNGVVSANPPDGGDWRVLFFIETFSKGTMRGIHFGEDDGEPGAPPAADLLNPEAVRKFIRLTYERYYSALRQYFGNTIIAFFTDEPDLLGRCARSAVKPWTPGFLDDFKAAGNECSDLPALWFEMGPDTEAKLRNYRRGLNKRLENSYYRQLAEWCREHGIALTGHPQNSDAIGLLAYFDIPGQDLVWRWVAPEDGKGLAGSDSTIAKCSSDAGRHRGRRRNANECFGCCGPQEHPWAFSMADQKWYLDWLLVRGVNLIIPHAFYYSLAGERINERPPDVGPNNIWWPYYGTIADYIKRLSWLMTDSYNVTPLAVLCQEDNLPWRIVKPLYQNQIEFNYLEADLILSGACTIANGSINIQQQKYQALIIEDPGMVTGELGIRLAAFKAGGGKLILYNPDPKQAALKESYEIKSFESITALVDELVGRDLRIDPPNPDLRVSHIIKDGCHFYLLVNEGETRIQGALRFKARGRVELWDAWSGKVWKPEGAVVEGGQCRMPLAIERRGSRIICIDPAGTGGNQVKTGKSLAASTVELELKGDWTLHCPVWETDRRLKLESWTNWPGMKYFSGTVVYETSFELPEQPGQIELDLGMVAENAHIYLNGQDAGFKLWAPYSFEITPWVKQGVNSLKVEVTNSLANRFNRAELVSGLIGPVKLRLRRWEPSK